MIASSFVRRHGMLTTTRGPERPDRVGSSGSASHLRSTPRSRSVHDGPHGHSGAAGQGTWSRAHVVPGRDRKADGRPQGRADRRGHPGPARRGLTKLRKLVETIGSTSSPACLRPLGYAMAPKVRSTRSPRSSPSTAADDLSSASSTAGSSATGWTSSQPSHPSAKKKYAARARLSQGGGDRVRLRVRLGGRRGFQRTFEEQGAQVVRSSGALEPWDLAPFIAKIRRDADAVSR